MYMYSSMLVLCAPKRGTFTFTLLLRSTQQSGCWLLVLCCMVIFYVRKPAFLYAEKRGNQVRSIASKLSKLGPVLRMALRMGMHAGVGVSRFDAYCRTAAVIAAQKRRSGSVVFAKNWISAHSVICSMWYVHGQHLIIDRPFRCEDYSFASAFVWCNVPPPPFGGKSQRADLSPQF